MTREEVCKYAENVEEEIMLLDNPSFDSAIIGISYDDRVIYDMDLMIKDLMKQDNINYLDALEFIEYNTLRAIPYFGNKAPIILYAKSLEDA